MRAAKLYRASKGENILDVKRQVNNSSDNIREHSIKFAAFCQSIDAKRYVALNENRDAFDTKNHYSRVVQIINEFKDIKLIKKELTRVNKGKAEYYLFKNNTSRKWTE